jgi:hypothetical protein
MEVIEVRYVKEVNDEHQEKKEFPMEVIEIVMDEND